MSGVAFRGHRMLHADPDCSSSWTHTFTDSEERVECTSCGAIARAQGSGIPAHVRVDTPEGLVIRFTAHVLQVETRPDGSVRVKALANPAEERLIESTGGVQRVWVDGQLVAG